MIAAISAREALDLADRRVVYSGRFKANERRGPDPRRDERKVTLG
jgi:hypothetical protein